MSDVTFRPTPAPPPSTGSTEPAALAASVRELACLAHRLLRDPSADAETLRDLHQRIARLRSRIDASRGGPLLAWLDSLALRLEPRETALASRPFPRRTTASAVRRALAGLGS